MLLVIEASEQAETVIAVFRISVVESLKELKLTNASFVPFDGQKRRKMELKLKRSLKTIF
jgi:hypothetical protein